MAKTTKKTTKTEKSDVAKKSKKEKKSETVKKKKATVKKNATAKKTTKPKKRTEEATKVIAAEERLKEEANAEIKRLMGVLKEAGVSKVRVKALKPIITNTAWIMVKLDDARAEIGSDSIVVPYDNGGGQTGLRENPIFRAYEALWKSYMAGMNKIIEALPEECETREAEIERPRTMLEIVRERHKTS